MASAVWLQRWNGRRARSAVYADGSDRSAATATESEAKLRALLIEKLKYNIAKQRHDKFERSAERGAILDQLISSSCPSLILRKMRRKPTSFPCCGGALHKIGEDVTETLELVPRNGR
jgi:transposase